MYLRLKNGTTQVQKIYWSVNMIWASSLSKLKPSTVSSKVALRYFMILSAHDYSILQYPSETLNTIWSSAGQWLVVNINKLFAQLHCLLGFGAKLESLSAYQPFWIFNGPFWFGVHQQGPGLVANQHRWSSIALANQQSSARSKRQLRLKKQRLPSVLY